MKKLYKKGAVHPTPPLILSDHLSFLPATILTLTVALSPQDREVLAYLISCSSTNYSGDRRSNNATRTIATAVSNSGSAGVGSRSSGGGVDHPPSFHCYCFRCYMSYWARWDSSPNRQLIHEIIDAFEDGLLVESKKVKSRKERRKSKGGSGGTGSSSPSSSELKRCEPVKNDGLAHESDSVECNISSPSFSSGGGADPEDNGGGEEEESEKGSVRRFVSFLGEKIWGVWN